MSLALQSPSVAVSQAPLSRDSATFVIYIKPWLEIIFKKLPACGGQDSDLHHDWGEQLSRVVHFISEVP